MGTIKEWIVGAVLALLASALLVSMGYLARRASMLREYGELAGQVRQQREQADAKLAELTAQRDMKQAALNKAAADQERKDNDAQAEIARLAGELRDRPVRVRIVPAAGGGCSGGAAGDAAGAAEAGAGDAASAYGLLPEENSRRFNDSLSEVETLSAAYNSCRARLIPQEPTP
ncbi:hypothetical protein AAER22_13525 [Pseudomonas aeruginosa]|uniref:hypothetical protein n=1 Tax=Pseudomonas aeruginosa TaxID=287 RepID=UPI000F524386|nr:hypothetical protein [Pseudomonas aeruginosa]RQG61863.1 hypothetical protein IPC197_09180 [Pseudomonas aeruginosa]